jgi:hypothetical protein
MNLKGILVLNNEYTQWRKDMDIQIESRRKQIEYTNEAEFPIDEFRSLNYDEAKKVFEVIKNNLDFQNQRKQLEKTLEEIKNKEYPILNKAHYYPVLNEIDFLTDKQKHELDKVLYRFKNRYIMTHSTAWGELRFDSNLTKRVFEFLYDKGIVQKNFILRCHCNDGECSPVIISEERYKKFIDYYSITKEEINKMTAEELLDYENRWSKEGYFEVPCWNDGYYEVGSIKELEDNIEDYYYKNVAEPDMTYANK